MDAEQEEYSEEEKNVDVSCNSEECQDIGQKTMVCLCFLLFNSPGKVARLTPFWFLGNGCRTSGVFRGREKRWRFLQLRGVPGYWTKNNGMSLFSTLLLFRKGRLITLSFWCLGNGSRTRGVFRGREKRWRFLQLRGVPGYWTKNNGMSFFSTLLLFRKGRLTPSFWFLGNGGRTRGVLWTREKRWRFQQLPGVWGYWSKHTGIFMCSIFIYFSGKVD